MQQKEPKILSEFLFECAMKGQWELVAEIYEKVAASRKARLTASWDIELHLAVSDGKHEVVSKLVKSLDGEASEILKVKNKSGNTALHTAAVLGYSYMCHCMATIDRSLIAECNNESATPLFLAALFGHEETFLCLHFLYQGKPLDSWSRKANGDSFLHAALKGGFFSLAFQIIRKYPERVNDINENGLTPLHNLATKPNAFKSGGRLGLFDQIIYLCITVDEIKEVQHDPAAELKRFKRTKDPCYPQNYGTCAQFFHMLIGVVFHGLPWEKIGSCDEENATQKKIPTPGIDDNHDSKIDEENAPQKRSPQQKSNSNHVKHLCPLGNQPVKV